MASCGTWSPHFIAVQGLYQRKCIVVFNIYAPHRPRDREPFYRSLGYLEIPCGALFVVGGDFNRTLDAVADRSYSSTSSSHDSPALKAFLATWKLVDSVAMERPQDWTSGELRRHHHSTHTYHYRLADGREASLRLDRWYVGPILTRWIDRTEVVDPVVHADHRAVQLRLYPPGNPVRVKKSMRLYPVPAHASVAVKEETEALLEDYLTQVDSSREASCPTWDDFKTTITKATRNIAEADGAIPTVSSITNGMAALSLQNFTGTSALARVRRAITDCKREKSLYSQKRLFTAAAHRDGKTTKDFFKRISCKYADNSIGALDTGGGITVTEEQEKAEAFAHAWRSILQQHRQADASLDAVVSWISKPDV
ncbi:reverse transcriptase [Phytophthora megakarya]|uniref:Reverse transcriptase n=1 Tax=Phytophthora megakarya TaxID=4795 RepID=A0A225VX66_9STRA|nr:reverse transcriptase [Phytophthora megakarya]